MRHLLIVCALALAGALAAPGRPADDKPKAKEKAKEKATPALDASLRLAAVSMGAYLYEAHQKIGMLSDGRANGAYTAAEADRELAVSVGLLKAVDKQLAALEEEADVPAEEKKHLLEARDVIKLQLDSAEGLKAYWKSKKEADAKTYTKNRGAAWLTLQLFLRVGKPGEAKKKDGKKAKG
jgi:hypothetical protein